MQLRLRAWRLDLDTNHSGTVTFVEFSSLSHVGLMMFLELVSCFWVGLKVNGKPTGKPP